MKGRGFVSAKYVGDDPRYCGKFLLITQIDDDLTVELLIGPGPENTIVLKGDQAEDYLRRVEVQRKYVGG